MSDALKFGSDYFGQIKVLVETLEELRFMNDRITQDSTMGTRYFADPNARTDIVVADVGAAMSALVAILATYDGSTPTKKSALFKML